MQFLEVDFSLQSPGPENRFCGIGAHFWPFFFWQSDLSAKSSCHWSSFYSKFLVLFAVLGRAKVAGDDDMARRPGIYWISWHMTRVPTHWCGCGVCCCFWRVFATLHCQAMERRYRRLSHTPIPSVKSPLPVIVWMSKILLA